MPDGEASAYSALMATTPPPPPDDTPEEQGISLRGLTEAFAQALGRVGPMTEPPEPAEESSDTESSEDGWDSGEHAPDEEPLDPWGGADDEEEDACPVNPRTILEAMLFVDNVENRPLESRRAAELMRGVEPSEIGTLVDELNETYRANRCPYRIASEGPGFRLQLRRKYFPLREKFHGRAREARLSQAAIDVLAVVAYQQPLTSDDVNKLRDRPSNHVLTQLVRRRLLKIERTGQRPRKTLYRTTDRFLDVFGLESLDDLPQSEELERR